MNWRRSPNAIREAKLKRRDIIEVVTKFLNNLHKDDALQVGYMLTLRINGTEPKSEVIKKILARKFE